MSQVLLEQGDLHLLEDPVAQMLLTSKQPVRMAYCWKDGTPRVVAMWFHWDGRQVVMGTPTKAPKLKALAEHPDVALVIDDASAYPYKELSIRGRVEITPHEGPGVVPEYALAAQRYLGEEQGLEWIKPLDGMPMFRLAVTPTWVALLDFEHRFPSALT